MPSIAIIIPCFNEADRLQTSLFLNFANIHSDIHLYFVDDGSTDTTGNILRKLRDSSERISLITLLKNRGKGEAVRQGILKALASDANYNYIGYLDADLSTSLEEFYSLCQTILTSDHDFVFASRIKKADTDIKRSYARHLIGRIIATVIDNKFKLGYYDTQCGAKIFSSAILRPVTDQPFLTRWFFDVELFTRLTKQGDRLNVLEIPLATWHNVKKSKLNILSFPTIVKELFILLTKY